MDESGDGIEALICFGRWANIITSKLDSVFHVRLVGSLGRRIEHIQQINHLSPKAARQFIRREDRGRKRYYKTHFGSDVADPLLYHLVINTDLVPYEEAARMIANAVLGRSAREP